MLTDPVSGLTYGAQWRFEAAVFRASSLLSGRWMTSAVRCKDPQPRNVHCSDLIDFGPLRRSREQEARTIG